MNQDQNPPPPFAPFQLPTPSIPLAPPTTKKRERKKPASKKPTAVAAKPASAMAAKPKRKTATTKRTPRFELQAILKVAAELREGDMPMFEKALGLLQDAPKASRERVLSALSKVFG